jgi:hypothetical protein
VAEAAVEDTVKDILVAHEALKEAKAGFGLAICGWVLGPPDQLPGNHARDQPHAHPARIRLIAL